jgi:predicted permease
MDSEDARRSLADMRRLQDRTLQEYIRRTFSRPGVLLLALGLFIVCASFDLPGRWDTAAVVLGDALIFAVIVVGYARASVRRKPNGAEVGIVLAVSAVLLTGFVALLIAGRLLGLPEPYTIAAAVTALAYVLLAFGRPTRRLYESILR